jgi:hypothetical protein
MIYYSQDARMYPLLTFFLLWALISAIKGKWRYFQIACIGALYTQYTAAFYIGVLFIGCFIYYFRDWRQLRRLRNSWAWISFGMLPWLPFLQSQASNLYFKYWIPRLTLSSAMLPSAEMTVGWRLPDGLLAHAYAAAFALTIVGLIASRHWIRQDKGVLWLAFTFGGPGLLAVVSVLWSPIFISRVILPAVACLIITWAYALQHLSTANRRIARLIVVPVVALSLAYHYWPDPTVARYDARVPMETISNQARSGDVVFYVEAESAVVFQYYNARLPYRLLPERGDLAQSLTDDTKAAMGLQMQSFDSLKDSGFKRVWLIASDNPLSSAEELQQIEWIKAHYQVELVRVDQRPSAEIYVYLVVL